MSMSPEAFHTLLGLCVVSAAAAIARAQRREKPFEPTEGQRGKDVVWVPTPPELVERMLDMARVTPQDYVIDLGSGDGRNVIAAAKRGAHALGVEYSAQMVEVSRHTAALAGVADRALFVQGDLYEADISHATVLALFLLPENLGTLSPKFLELAPGTRIVTNRFAIEGWEPDEISRIGGDSASCCTALLYVVPAKAGGRWQLADGELVLEQRFQMLSGTALLHGTRTPIENGRVRGDEISFSVRGDEYVGCVQGDVMKGRTKGHAAGEWSAMRIELTH
jgi:hypothetical protein